MSECALNDIIKMRAGICLEALYMILLNERCYLSERALYDVTMMGDIICLNALQMILLK